MRAQSIKAAVWVFVMGFFFAPLARPEPQKWTVVVVHSGSERLAVRISAELGSLGYEVKRMTMPPPIAEETLRSLAQAYSATAVMQVLPDGNAVEIWLVSRGTDNVIEIQEVEVPRETDQAEALAAFKAVELLRASLMTLPENQPETAPPPEPLPEPVPEPEPPPQEPPPQEPKPRKEKVKESRLSTALQPAAVFPFGGLKPAFNIGLSLYVRIAPRLFLDLVGLIPSFSQSVDAPLGTFELLSGVVTAGVRVNLLPARYRIVPSISALAGPVFIRTRGHLESDFEGFTNKEPLTIVPLLGGAFALTLHLNEYFSLRTDAAVGAVLIKPVFEMPDGTFVAEYGRLVISALFGVEVRLL